MKPAKIVEQEKSQAPSQDAEVKLFDFGQSEQIKESFVANRETEDPLEGPKLYLNVVYHDRMLPPISPNKDLGNPKDDSTW